MATLEGGEVCAEVCAVMDVAKGTGEAAREVAREVFDSLERISWMGATSGRYEWIRGRLGGAISEVFFVLFLGCFRLRMGSKKW